ncbi:MAG: biopolymer transporter ExbD [Candidatus Nitrohelix vancouverensis]|uniref:Biopolymer transporter ExbD n=1 Tax=Candidatus Nitrohelix vancouverensis TaxID=2705534 RepID=A0A7T0G298_9BACT|nr:MAG: biopolymer transporter ExbD [Candidatus Nitrohelix vancouverensis]
MIQFKQKRKDSFRLDLAPMINIVFLLLIFFMLTSTAIQSGLQVDLPDAESAEQLEKRHHLVRISKDQALEYEGKPVDLDALGRALVTEVEKGKPGALEIQSDKDVEFEFFGQVIERARESGVEEFIFATDRLESEGRN